MSIQGSRIEQLPSALAGDLAERLAGSRPAVFLDYDGTLTPIVDRPGTTGSGQATPAGGPT
jgi:trehalose 6-phosphate phosphatase